MVADLDDAHKKSEGDTRPWTIYAGDWSHSDLGVSAGKMVADSNCWRVNFMDSVVSESTLTLDGLIDGLID